MVECPLSADGTDGGYSVGYKLTGHFTGRLVDDQNPPGATTTTLAPSSSGDSGGGGGPPGVDNGSDALVFG